MTVYLQQDSLHMLIACLFTQALDAAAPYYEYQHVDAKLDPTDADFVDVIHTDSRSILIKGFGIHEPAGHMDFYPNGGYEQPDCRSLDNGLYHPHSRTIKYTMYVKPWNTRALERTPERALELYREIVLKRALERERAVERALEREL